MGHHDCTKLLSRLFLALDGELSEDEEKQFLSELNECSCCLEHYQVEKMFKNFLCDKIQKKQVKAGVIQEIRNRIQATAAA
jgi:anti-sigma factor (TIGR02949 family)